VFVEGGIPELRERWGNVDKTLLLLVLATAHLILFLIYFLTPLLQRIIEWYLPLYEQEPQVVERETPIPDQEASDWNLSYLRGAMRRVNIDLFQSDFMLHDLGLLVYRDANDKYPELLRVHPIPKKAHYLRPFVALQLWQQQMPKATPVTLELCEEHSRVLYQYDTVAVWDESDTTLILPTTWLDVTNVEKDLRDKNWSIRVQVDGKLLALHLVYWSKFDEDDIAKEHRRDGEISPKLRRLMEQERDSTNINLDDLLADQTIGEN
jgi:hypothetical protein